MRHNKPNSDRFYIKRALSFLAQLEEALLTTLLMTMILLACYQIALRWFTSGGLPWIDPLLRYLVLWGGLLGAALATSKGKHISLDIISYLTHGRTKQFLNIITEAFSTIIALFLFRATLLFISSEIEFGGNGLFGFPTWVWNLIFPIAFGMICLQFAAATLLSIKELFSADGAAARSNPSS